MTGIQPSYEAEWEPFSAGHEQLARAADQLLADYARSKKGQNLAHAVVGTFGAGKTQFLCHVFRRALAAGVTPWYVGAEHLFREILIADGPQWLPAQLSNLVIEKVSLFRHAVANREESQLRELAGAATPWAHQMVDELLDYSAEGKVNTAKIVLLVDELEQEYARLQQRVQADDRSPLREWIDTDPCLKMLALAPAGIYEMGGADQRRVQRWTLPGVDPTYVRANSGLAAARANAAWWLSRGKPSHLTKALNELRTVPTGALSADAVLLLCSRLDRIGQEPSAVPPAELDVLEPSSYGKLLDLASQAAEPMARVLIDVPNTEIGAVADKFRLAFPQLDSTSATRIAEYSRTVMWALADDKGLLAVAADELPDLIQMALDLLLEYEHATPGIAEQLGDILRLYDSMAPGALFPLAQLWSMPRTEDALPINCQKLRQVFPFPIMNPTVKGHLAAEAQAKHQGTGHPVWRWSLADHQVFVFAARRDLESYADTDAFRAEVFPDGKLVKCIVPNGDRPGPPHRLMQWLADNSKLYIVDAPPLAFNFLMSLAGELGERVPGDLGSVLETLSADHSDPITARKVGVYQRAIEDLVSQGPRTAPRFFGPLPSDTNDTWGEAHIDRRIAVLACSQAFRDPNEEEGRLLISLQELFRSGTSGGRGGGDLRPFLERGGLPSLVDLLPTPRTARQGGDHIAIQRLRPYFGSIEPNLQALAEMLDLPGFLKLHNGEDQRRLLEALWRTLRREFEEPDFQELLRSLGRAVQSARKAVALEKAAAQRLLSGGINFGGDTENLVRNDKALERLLTYAKDAQSRTSNGAALMRALYAAFIQQVLAQTEPLLARLEPQLVEAQRALDLLSETQEALVRNTSEFARASAFIGIDREAAKRLAQQTAKIEGPVTLDDLCGQLAEAKQDLAEVSAQLQQLDSTLGQIEDSIATLRGTG